MSDNKVAEQEESGWRPIETAPRDGTLVRLCVKGYEPTVGKLVTEHSTEVGGQWVDFDPEGAFETDFELREHLKNGLYEPTHWMPLTEPPK